MLVSGWVHQISKLIIQVAFIHHPWPQFPPPPQMPSEYFRDGSQDNREQAAWGFKGFAYPDGGIL